MMRTAVLTAGVAAWSAPTVMQVGAQRALAVSPPPSSTTTDSTKSTDSGGSGGLLTDVVDDTVSTAGSLLRGVLGGG